jgi:hypothetical protein
LSSPYSCAASVLLWLITSAGFPRLAMTCAMVSVFPVPVAPSSVWYLSPRLRPSVSSSMARGWSPAGRRETPVRTAFYLVCGPRRRREGSPLLLPRTNPEFHTAPGPITLAPAPPLRKTLAGFGMRKSLTQSHRGTGKGNGKHLLRSIRAMSSLQAQNGSLRPESRHIIDGRRWGTRRAVQIWLPSQRPYDRFR